MATGSFFRRVTRYPVGTLDPRENRLTESFAAVLQGVDGLPHAVARSWLESDGIDKDWDARVDTQVLTRGGRFIDLELAFFGPSETPQLLVWVENKHGAPLSGETQVNNYLCDIEREAGETKEVVLIAPRHEALRIPPEATRVVWQETAAEISKFAGAPGRGAVARWLLRQFHDYLEEESLAEEGALRPKHTTSLKAAPESARLLSGLLDFADRYMESHWAPTSEPRKVLKWPGMNSWRLFPTCRQGQTPTWPDGSRWGLDAHHGWHFQLSLYTGALPDETREEPALYAGAVFEPLRLAPSLGDEEVSSWLAPLVREMGFQYDHDEWGWYLLKRTYLEELVGPATLDEQAEHLGQWACAIFEELAKSPPPPPA